MSKLPSSTDAAFFERATRRFMPSDILKVKNTATAFEADFMFSISTSLKPVVATTIGVLFATAYSSKSGRQEG